MSIKGKLKRGPQIVTPKDASLILAYTGIDPGSKVVDAGTGSGFLAIFLAKYINPGKVYTYENDERFSKLARENVKISGLKNVVSRTSDITRGIKEKNVDAVVLDMKDAYKVVRHSETSLKRHGHLVVYSPTVDHLLKSLGEIEKRKFENVRIVENIVREWKHEHTLRPKTMGIMHTGFLIFARKI